MEKITISDCEYLAKKGYYAVVSNGEVIGFTKVGDENVENVEND